MIIEEPHSAQEIAINDLRTKGLCVNRFRSGIEAIQASKLADYVMIFIDSRLPDMSGQDVAKAIRAVTAHSQTPLIAMVDHSNEAQKVAKKDGVSCNNVVFSALVTFFSRSKVEGPER